MSSTEGRPSRGKASGGPLSPLETASSAVMAAAAVAIVVLSSIVSVAGPLGLLATVPYGVVTRRHRPRALFAAVVASGLLSFVIVGVGGAVHVAECAILGGLVGEMKRRHRGAPTLLAVALVLGAIASAAADLLLWGFGAYRQLLLETTVATERGVTRTAAHLAVLRTAAHDLDRLTDAAVTHWPWTVAAIALVAVPAVLLVTWLLLGAVLDRLNWASAVSPLPLPSHGDPGGGPPVPLPVEFVGVGLRYPGACVDALSGVNLLVPQGQFIVVVGDNGSGKSSLAHVLAGTTPTTGLVRRPGRSGLGEVGGTALILQRPDTQVLGSRVAADVVWGLPPDCGVDVEALLREVGLAGLGDRETASLSEGQLQRLALAAALVRRPRLLISDESTAMIDPQGRAELITLLAGLTRSRAMSVVHVTHNADEMVAADRLVRLQAGRIVSDGPVPAHAVPQPQPLLDGVAEPIQARADRDTGVTGLVMRGVGHTYRRGTPWAQVALADVDLSIGPGSGVLITGDNGSGKSTLAWIIAGLTAPTEGHCLLDGHPVSEQRQHGRIALAFQHSRLQLQRPTVAADILDATGHRPARTTGRRRVGPSASARTVPDALALAGLSDELADRHIDQLSGGQMRRVALAGLLARTPRVLVLDEPLAGLDPSAATNLIDVLAVLRRRGITVIAVSHDTQQLGAVLPRHVRVAGGRIVADSGMRLAVSNR